MLPKMSAYRKKSPVDVISGSAENLISDLRAN